MINWTSPNALAEAIKRSGFSVTSFAKASGVSRTQLHRLINGDFFPNFRTQAKIEATLAQAANNTRIRANASSAKGVTPCV